MQKLIPLLILATLPLAAQTTTTVTTVTTSAAPAAAAVPAPKPPQLKLPRVSPNAELKQTVGLTDITITYSRPAVKGRQIWGSLVPYDQVWRTGANDATTIAFSDDVMVGATKVPAGKYSLHTIPSQGDWTIIMNGTANQWGSFTYDPAKDAVRIKATPEKAEFREWLAFEIPKMTTDEATIAIRWENLSVPFTIRTNSTERSMANIRTAMAQAAPNDWTTPYRAATFAFESDDMADARMWLDSSIKAKETMANLWLRARIQARAGDKAAAMRTVDSALALAGPDDKIFAAEIKRMSSLWK
jgi:hypothetical protein